ncbi:hypothetical protein ACFTAO_40605 [Paenibacillus rhizoplanae]
MENVKLYIPSLDRSINANNFDSAMPPEELEGILNPAHMKSPIFGMGEKLLMSGVYPDAVYAGRPPVLAIEIQLSRPEILRSLSSMAEGGGRRSSMDGHWRPVADCLRCGGLAAGCVRGSSPRGVAQRQRRVRPIPAGVGRH